MVRRLSPTPDIDEVAGQPAWHQKDGVDANVLTRSRIARGKAFGRHRHTAQPIFIERHGRRVFACPLLHFDECNGAPALGDKVDFAARDTRPAGEDPPTVKA